MTQTADVVMLRAMQSEVITDRTAGLAPIVSRFGPLNEPNMIQKCAGKYSSCCFGFISQLIR